MEYWSLLVCGDGVTISYQVPDLGVNADRSNRTGHVQQPCWQACAMRLHPVSSCQGVHVEDPNMIAGIGSNEP